MVQIGFDIGGSKIAAGIVNKENRIIARKELPFPTGKPYAAIAGIMAEMIDELLKTTRVPEEEVESIGMSVPGQIDADSGTVINAHNLQFHNVPLREAMQEYYPRIPIFLANDANAAALAELYAGALRGAKTAILLTLGTGLGGGVILDGKMFNGGLGHGIEPGHMALLHEGPICSCGNRGCAETLCTATWLIRQGRKAIIEYPLSLIYTKTGGDLDKITAKLVIDCAREGDAVAADIFDRFIDQLSSAITSCTVLFDPEVIAIGGGVARAGDFLFQPLREQVKNKSFFHYPYRVVPAELGNDAGIVGAAMLVHNSRQE